MNPLNVLGIAVGAIIAATPGANTQADELTTAELEGAWELVSYETADDQPPAAGLQLVQDGHFSIIYQTTFTGQDEPSARSHAGTYRVEGDHITYDVSYWVQHVNGEGSLVPATSVSPTYEYDGSNLKLAFGSGSKQHWRRID
ncbi:hypothetical protein [Elongatibacter sediminis]|uniref:Lipocalin-like domain-containing protein n=1 Tax=Elongatibacter sediminis TaxID=3119006 RepID=A0AAW9RDP0_9GAMM